VGILANELAKVEGQEGEGEEEEPSKEGEEGRGCFGVDEAVADEAGGGSYLFREPDEGDGDQHDKRAFGGGDNGLGGGLGGAYCVGDIESDVREAKEET